MKGTKRSTVVGVFHNHEQADRAVEELRRAGFTNEQIGVVAPDPGKGGATGAEASSHVGEGALAGVAAGAGVGGLVGLGILAGVIPVLGPVIAGGTLAVILANAAGGAAMAGLVGALVGLGIPEDEARHYEGEFKAGRTIVTVKGVGGRYAEVQGILQRHGAYNRDNPAAAASGPGSTTEGMARSTGGGQAADRRTIQVREEELRAGKQPVQAGEVRLRKEVVTETKTL